MGLIWALDVPLPPAASSHVHLLLLLLATTTPQATVMTFGTGSKYEAGPGAATGTCPGVPSGPKLLPLGLAPGLTPARADRPRQGQGSGAFCNPQPCCMPLCADGWYTGLWADITAPLKAAGVPWAIILGNHDDEGDLNRT